MTYSLGEVDALCRKAARGAGFSWGMAEEAGRAVRWLSSWNQPGAAALAGYLTEGTLAHAPEDPTAQDWSAQGPLCPLICGALLSDMGDTPGERRLRNLAWPLLMVPHGLTGQTIAWTDATVTWDGALAITGTPLSPLAATFTITQTSTPITPQSRPTTRVTLTEADLATLTRFAARTYAPETDASKLSGAGAGLTDED